MGVPHGASGTRQHRIAMGRKVWQKGNLSVYLDGLFSGCIAVMLYISASPWRFAGSVYSVLLGQGCCRSFAEKAILSLERLPAAPPSLGIIQQQNLRSPFN